MTSEASAVATAPPSFTVRRAMLATLVVTLIAFVIFAAVREWRAASTPEVAVAPAVAERPALTADEERYARDLWTIHEQVRTNVPRLSFAGLAYKMDEIGKGDIATRIAPVAAVLTSARAAMQPLTPPRSLAAAHRDYLGAIDAYQQVMIEMGAFSRDGDEQHLLRAQELSERASGTLLRVSEVLWPGEHKPN